MACLLLFFLLSLRSCRVLSSSHCWGYQISGSGSIISNLIDVDQDGHLYLVGLSPILSSLFTFEFSDNSMISKISPHGINIWTHFWSKDLRLSPISLGFGNSSVYLAADSLGRSYLVRICRHTGKIIWQTGDNLFQLNESSVTLTAVVADEQENAYVLFSRSVTEWSTPTRDMLKKIDATMETIWEVQCSNENSLTTRFTTLNLNSDSQIEIKGRSYDDRKHTQTYLMKSFSSTNGETISTTSLKSWYREKSRFEAVYKNDEYHLRSTKRHEYGTDITLIEGSVINKNWCDDGYYLKPFTQNSSRPAECAGLSWSVSDHHRQLTCTYYFGRMNAVGIMMIFLLPLILILWASYHLNLSAVHILSSLLSSFAFSSDLSYLFGVVFYNLLYFALAIGFFLLPGVHLLEYIRQATKRQRMNYLFNPPRLLTPFVVVSSRGGVPHFRDIRCFPTSMHPSEDLIFLLGGWALVISAQFFYSLLWLLFHFFRVLPWFLVHFPWYLIIFLWGYVLYRLGFFQHHVAKDRWLHLFFSPYSFPMLGSPPSSKDDGEGEGTTNEDIESCGDTRSVIPDSSWDLLNHAISIFLLSFIGEFIVQWNNNRKMRYHGLLSSLCLVSKCLYTLNILNRFAVGHGPLLASFLRSFFSSFFPNYPSLISFMSLSEHDSEESQRSSSETRLRELEAEVASLKDQLSQYHQLDAENSLGLVEIKPTSEGIF
jgi:hypothetical protein